MNQATPLISVLIAVKNGGEKFNLTLNSLANQSLDSSLFEVLICDDGSTDGTSDLVKKWEEKGVCKLTVENKRSLGLTQSLIALAKNANGKYLARVDIGDTCDPERLQEQSSYLNHNPSVGIVCSSAYLVSQNGKVIGPLFSPLKREVTLRHLVQRNIVTHGSVMMRKEAYDAVGGYDPAFTFAQDFDLWTKMASQGVKIHWIKKSLYNLELDEKGISATKKEEQGRLSQQIRNRYKAAAVPEDGIKTTDLAKMRLHATLRGMPVIGGLIRVAEGLVFELKSRT